VIRVEVNGRLYEREVEPRTLLTDFLRHDLGLTGTHVGCEQGTCGACTVHLDGAPIKGCLLLAVQADGHAVRTVEGLAGGGALHPLQQAFHEQHALQCGFCTPGFLMAVEPQLHRLRTLDDVARALDGNLCRCTGYEAIVAAVAKAAGVVNEP
jgi:aerobic-type carbon monoxide dehydrogenase small subunit (CoxS/CutS family)